jgi:glycosyltransferase involved in cell wall biosynthesis
MSHVREKELTSNVAILLSSYNGGVYLKEQLDSLIAQDYENYHVFCRDDGSKDNTVDILKEYSSRYPELIFFNENDFKNLGVKESFFSLLRYVDDESCLMFCDQDDVWDKNKVSTFVSELAKNTTPENKALPIMVFGDMLVVDESLAVISNSFWNYQRLDLKIVDDWRRVMVSNIVTGCSSLLNPVAVSFIRKAPEIELLHDHLSAIIVAKEGKLVGLTTPTMLYRQHQTNVEGARSFSALYLLNRLSFFITEMVPRYRLSCKAFGLPYWLAAVFKVQSVFRRLFL